MAAQGAVLWHSSSRRQYTFVVEGTLEVETGHGEKRRFEKGHFYLTADTTGQGHVTRNVGDGDLVMALLTAPSQ